MTKISNTGNNIWNLLEQAAASKGEDRKQIRDVVPELNGRQIKTDSLELSREGMAALREKVQSMPGHMDVEEIKQSKGNYTLDDLISIRMDAYTRQYDALQKSHEDGSRDIYISDGIDENGKLQYHKVSQEEEQVEQMKPVAKN